MSSWYLSYQFLLLMKQQQGCSFGNGSYEVLSSMYKLLCTVFLTNFELLSLTNIRFKVAELFPYASRVDWILRAHCYLTDSRRL